MFKFKVGDEVQITTGRDKGKKGKVEKVARRKNALVVAGVNIYKRHRKVSKKQPAGVFEVERPIPVANLAIVCPKCGKPTRVGFVIEGKTKNRICKKCQGRV